MMSEEKKANPIDPDKITENPHNLPYAHAVGGAVIRPEDKGKIKGRAMSAMEQQTDKQLGQIHKQIQLLAEQAKDIQRRKDISEQIYMAEMGFEPLVGHTYHLYKRDSGGWILSLLSPDDWGRGCPHEFVETVTLLADHTWEIVPRDQD